MKPKQIASLALCFFIFAPANAFAHLPRIVSETPVIVTEPEISKAYYAALAGEPHVYRISSEKPWTLYAGLLVPDRPGQNKDVSAAVVAIGKEEKPVAFLDGNNFAWEPYYEEFGADNYFKGPEFKKELLPAGDYEIRVWSRNNDSRYALATGETESFTLAETINTWHVIPRLKSGFFGSSPFTFLKSPLGIAFVFLMFVLAWLAAFISRAAVKLFSKSKPRQRSRNIGKNGRAWRAVLGGGFLVFGIYAWSAVLLFLAGWCFFEAVFGWCGFYAVLGKNTLPPA